MAVYGISKEGADALKQLATDMSTLNNDIQEKVLVFMKSRFLSLLPALTRRRKKVVNLLRC